MFSDLHRWQHQNHWLNALDQSLFFNLNQINILLRREISQKHVAQIRKTKTSKVVLRRWNHRTNERKLKKCEIIHLTKREIKTIWRGDCGSKLTINCPSLEIENKLVLNHHSSIEQEEEKWRRLWFVEEIREIISELSILFYYF